MTGFVWRKSTLSLHYPPFNESQSTNHVSTKSIDQSKAIQSASNASLSGPPTKKVAVSFHVARISTVAGDERRDHASSVASSLFSLGRQPRRRPERERPQALAPSDVALISWQHGVLSCSFKARQAPVAAGAAHHFDSDTVGRVPSEGTVSNSRNDDARAGTKPANNVERGVAARAASFFMLGQSLSHAARPAFSRAVRGSPSPLGHAGA